MRSFDGIDLYLDIPAKAAALAFFLVSTTRFVDARLNQPTSETFIGPPRVNVA
jgi:hypothetical protein